MDLTLAVNLAGYVHMIQACLPFLARDGAGRIVNIASTEGLGATPYISPYTVSKHGVVGLTRSLACELGPQGVTVNCICPGPINTGMTAPIPDDAKAKFARRRVPLRRYGDPEEVAQVVLSVALPASSFLNGAVIPVDGGLTGEVRLIARPSPARLVEVLQQPVRGEFHVLVPPLRGAVLARDQPAPVHAVEVAVHERVPRLGLVARTFGESEVPLPRTPSTSGNRGRRSARRRSAALHPSRCRARTAGLR